MYPYLRSGATATLAGANVVETIEETREKKNARFFPPWDAAREKIYTSFNRSSAKKNKWNEMPAVMGTKYIYSLMRQGKFPLGEIQFRPPKPTEIKQDLSTGRPVYEFTEIKIIQVKQTNLFF